MMTGATVDLSVVENFWTDVDREGYRRSANSYRGYGHLTIFGLVTTVNHTKHLYKFLTYHETPWGNSRGKIPGGKFSGEIFGGNF